MAKVKSFFCTLLFFLLLMPLQTNYTKGYGELDGSTAYATYSYSFFSDKLIWDQFDGAEDQYVKNQLRYTFVIKYKFKYIFVSYDESTGNSLYKRQVISWKLVTFYYERYWVGIEESGWNPRLKEDYFNILPIPLKYDKSIYDSLNFQNLVGEWHYDKDNCDALPFHNDDDDSSGVDDENDMTFIYPSSEKYVSTSFPLLSRSSVMYLYLKMIQNDYLGADVEHATMMHIGDGNQIYRYLSQSECDTLSYLFTIPSYLSNIQYQEGEGSGDDGDDGTNPPDPTDPPFSQFP